MLNKNIFSPFLRVSVVSFIVLLGSISFLSVSRGDEAEVEKGKKLFQERGCMACHSIGKGKIAGPDLLGVTQRRDEEWLKKWLKSPDTMILTDPIAKEMLGIYMVPMPNLGLSDEDIEALLEYFEYEDSSKKSN